MDNRSHGIVRGILEIAMENGLTDKYTQLRGTWVPGNKCHLFSFNRLKGVANNARRVHSVDNLEVMLLPLNYALADMDKKELEEWLLAIKTRND